MKKTASLCFIGRRIVPSMVAMSLLIMLAGCNLGGSGGIKVAVSVQKADSAGKAARGFHIDPITDETYYKAELKSASRGGAVGTYTPEVFVLDLDSLSLYSKSSSGSFTTECLSQKRTNPYGYIIPRHVNLLHASGFIRDVELGNLSWDGITMQFLPGVGDSAGMPFRSLLAVRLPSQYNDVKLKNEEARGTGQDSDLHYFSFQSLQPFVSTFLSYLTIGANLPAAGIQNPGGLMPANVGDSSWSLPDGETSGNATALFLPGQAIDFTGYVDPEILLSWDTTDLIQVWDEGSADPVEHVASFNLSDPFPASLSAREKSGSVSGGSGDTTPPADVLLPAIAPSRDAAGPRWNTLLWINPEDADFDKVMILRKADSSPTGSADAAAEKVYEGYEPNYVDATGVSGTHYYYAVYALDYSGNASSGVVLEGTQP